jgi:DNA-binding CsgD family transcriptional regulator
MPKKIFYSGLKLGRLTLIEETKQGNKNFWKVKCQCGHEQKYRTDYFHQMKCLGRIFECEHCKYARRYPALNDKIFGRLTVIKEVESFTKDSMWLVHCECGVEKSIKRSSLTSKSKGTKSCGCLARKLHSKWVNTTQYPPAHGLRTKETEELDACLYHCRNAFVAACYRKEDPRYSWHGLKGHSVCDLWRNGAIDYVLWAKKNGFSKGDGIFLKEGKTIFSPENCYIMSKKQRSKLHNSKFIEFNGQKKSITDWAKDLGCAISCLSVRLKKYKKYGLDKIMDLNWIAAKNQKYGTEHLENEIISMYKEGKSFQEISDYLNCSTSTIKRFLDKNNISTRAALCRSSIAVKEKLPVVDELINKGFSMKEISEKLNVSYSTLTYHYRKHLEK